LAWLGKRRKGAFEGSMIRQCAAQLDIFKKMRIILILLDALKSLLHSSLCVLFLQQKQQRAAGVWAEVLGFPEPDSPPVPFARQLRKLDVCVGGEEIPSFRHLFFCDRRGALALPRPDSGGSRAAESSRLCRGFLRDNSPRCPEPVALKLWQSQ
jgi:hypothetical protein